MHWRGPPSGRMQAETDYALAIELGSSGPKVSLVSGQGGFAARACGQTSNQNTPDGGGEQHPDKSCRAIGDCVKTVLHQARNAAARVATRSASQEI